MFSVDCLVELELVWQEVAVVIIFHHGEHLFVVLFISYVMIALMVNIGQLCFLFLRCYCLL